MATYAHMNPVIAVGLGALILTERLTPATVAGGVLIVGAWCPWCGTARPRTDPRDNERMGLEINRLHLASLRAAGGDRWPVHGFVVTHDDGAVLVDTGVGGPQQMLDDWRVVNRTVAAALAELDMSPADIDLVINTHLHFDHCGQNAAFRHAPFFVQRAELRRAQREAPELRDWIDFSGARFELLDGDAQILPGLRVVATPGHTEGHQCVLVSTAGAALDVLIGDGAYTPRVYTEPGPADGTGLPPGQASDIPAWRSSLRRVQALRPDRVHFCHHTDVLHR